MRNEQQRAREDDRAIIWNINEGYLPSAPEGSRDPLMNAVRQAFLQ